MIIGIKKSSLLTTVPWCIPVPEYHLLKASDISELYYGENQTYDIRN